MKRHNTWGTNSIKKYFRLSTDPGKGNRFAASDSCIVSTSPEDGGPINNTDLKTINNMDNTTEKPSSLPDPRTPDQLTGHTIVDNHPNMSNPPGLLPTPVGKKLTSNFLTYQQLSNDWKTIKNDILDQSFHKNSDDNSPCDLDVSLTETIPTTSRYCRNLDEFLLSDSEITLNNSEAQQLTVSSQPEVCTPQSMYTASDSNNFESSKIVDVRKNRVPGPVIDRKKYQYGTGYDDILKLASQNVKRQRRHSLQSSECQKHDGSSNHRVRHRSSGIMKKKKCQESPRKLPPLLARRFSENSLVVADHIQSEIDKTTMKLCVPKLDVSGAVSITEELVAMSVCSCIQKIERKSLFHSFSNSQHHQPRAKVLEDLSMDTADRIPTDENHDRSSPVKSCKLPEGLDVESSQISMDCYSSDENRENVGLFDRFRSPSKNPPDETAEALSSKDNRPKKNIMKSLLNLNLLKERFARKCFLKALEKQGGDAASTTTSSNLQRLESSQTENEGMMEVSVSHNDMPTVIDVADDVVNNDVDMVDTIVDSAHCKSQSDSHEDCKQEPDKTTEAFSSKDNQPKINMKNLPNLNLNLLKERLAGKHIMRALKKHGGDAASTSTSSNLQRLESSQTENEGMMEVSVSHNDMPTVIDDIVADDVNNDVDMVDTIVDSADCKSQSDSREICKQEPEYFSTPVLLSSPASNQTTRPTMKDGTDDDDDDDDFELISSDDDEDLPEPSIYLGDPVNRKEQSWQTEENEMSFSQDSLNNSTLDSSLNEFDIQPPKPKCFKLTLDKMVRHKQDNDLKDAEIAKMSKELQKDMVSGWMDRANCEDNSADNILPDHKKQLDNFACPTDHVPDIYPGDHIFNLDHIGEVFSFPSTLRLADCGFRPVKGKATDALLWRASPDDLVGLINSCLLVEAHLIRPCQDSLMVWMFYLLSIHGNIHTIMQAFQTLWSLMNNSIKFNQNRIWLPTLKQTTRVLLNYGATFESLFPAPGLEPAFSLNDVMNESGKGKENMVEEETENIPKNQSWTPKKQFPVIALNHVIKVITHGMQLRNMHKQPVFYSEEELKQLVGVICRAGLETQGKEDTHGEDFVLCTSALLEGFPVTSWSIKCKELCEALPGLTNHHHNLVHLVDLFPTFTDRGRQIRRLLSYYALHKLLSEASPTGSVKIEKISLTPNELKVFHVFPLIRSLHPEFDTDYYRLHSMVMLIDMCVGNEPLPSKEKSDLYTLNRDISKLSGDVRASPYYPSRSKVKHVLQRILIKLSIMADNMVSKQFDTLKYVGLNEMDTPVEHLIDSKDECGSDVESVDEELMEVIENRHISVSSDDTQPLIVSDISNDEDSS